MYASGTPNRVAIPAVIAAACRLSKMASLTAAIPAACRKLATDEVVTSRMIGSTMNASSRPPSSQVTTPNQPDGQLRAGCPACVVVFVVVTWSL